jgi:hypothetical protein
MGSGREQGVSVQNTRWSRPEPASIPLPRYERPHESGTLQPERSTSLIPLEQAASALAASPLSPGSQQLARGLLRLGAPAVFPGGGIGIEYGALLKTAARPDYLAGHIREAAAHLHQRQVDLLLVPGMSGYPIGSMYAIASGIPAVLLKKVKMGALDQASYPAGAFVIPSYTGDGDVVMHADPAAAQDIIDEIAGPQLASQANTGQPVITLRCAGADDIIDKAIMSQAVGESAVVIGQVALADFVARHRAATGDQRPIATEVEVVAWVTPIIKTYNQPEEHLKRVFNLVPFAGISVTSVQLEPPAIGIGGVGIVRTTPS